MDKEDKEALEFPSHGHKPPRSSHVVRIEYLDVDAIQTALYLVQPNVHCNHRSARFAFIDPSRQVRSHLEQCSTSTPLRLRLFVRALHPIDRDDYPLGFDR